MRRRQKWASDPKRKSGWAARKRCVQPWRRRPVMNPPEWIGRRLRMDEKKIKKTLAPDKGRTYGAHLLEGWDRCCVWHCAHLQGKRLGFHDKNVMSKAQELLASLGILGCLMQSTPDRRIQFQDSIIHNKTSGWTVFEQHRVGFVCIVNNSVQICIKTAGETQLLGLKLSNHDEHMMLAKDLQAQGICENGHGPRAAVERPSQLRDKWRLCQPRFSDPFQLSSVSGISALLSKDGKPTSRYPKPDPRLIINNNAKKIHVDARDSPVTTYSTDRIVL